MREIHHVGLTRYSIIRGSLIVTSLKYNHDHNFYHNSLHWFLRLICNFLKSVSKPFHYIKHNPKIKKLKQDKAQQFRTIGRHCQPSLCGTSLHCPRGPMQPQSYSRALAMGKVIGTFVIWERATGSKMTFWICQLSQWESSALYWDVRQRQGQQHPNIISLQSPHTFTSSQQKSFVKAASHLKISKLLHTELLQFSVWWRQ